MTRALPVDKTDTIRLRPYLTDTSFLTLFRLAMGKQGDVGGFERLW